VKRQEPVETSPAGTSSKADSPDKTAMASPEDPPAFAAHGKRGQTSNKVAAETGGERPNGSSARSFGVVGIPAPVALDAGPAGFNKPHSKTIDVP
jgi:hypothetical protein